MQLTQSQRDMLAKFILDGLRKTERADPIVRTEILLDRVDLFLQTQTEESGVGVLSSTPLNSEVIDYPVKVDANARQMAAPQPPPVAPAAVLRAPSADPDPEKLVAMPGDKEFSEYSGSVNLNKVRPRRKPHTQSTRPQWDAGDLIRAIEDYFPKEIAFTPNGMPQTVKVVANRNILNMPSNDLIRVEYASSQVNEGGGGVQQTEGIPDQPVVFGLTARWTFSLFDAEQDFEGALRGKDKGIIDQLRGLYKPRGRSMEPNSGPDPGPLRFNMDNEPMRESYSSPVQGNWDVIDTGSVRDSQIRDNKVLGRLVV